MSAFTATTTPQQLTGLPQSGVVTLFNDGPVRVRVARSNSPVLSTANGLPIAVGGTFDLSAAEETADPWVISESGTATIYIY